MPLRRSLVFTLMSVLLTGPVLAETGGELRAMPIPEETGTRVSLGDITDNRTTGQHFARLEIEFKTEGDALAQAFAVAKPVITGAVDDTGRSLLKDEKKQDPMFWSLELQDKPRNSVQARSELLNPARKATSISFTGYVDVLNPKLDPAALYTVNDLAAQAGKPLLPEAFQQAGLTLTVLTKALADKMKQDKAQAMPAKPENPGQAMGEAFGAMFKSMFSGFFSMGENDLLFVVKDPKRQIAYLQVCDAQGVPLKQSGGRSMSQDETDGTVRYTVSFGAPLPQGAQLKIYFATPKSTQRVPFRFENVRLP